MIVPQHWLLPLAAHGGYGCCWRLWCSESGASLATVRRWRRGSLRHSSNLALDASSGGRPTPRPRPRQEQPISHQSCLARVAGVSQAAARALRHQPRASKPRRISSGAISIKSTPRKNPGDPAAGRSLRARLASCASRNGSALCAWPVPHCAGILLVIQALHEGVLPPVVRSCESSVVADGVFALGYRAVGDPIRQCPQWQATAHAEHDCCSIAGSRLNR